MDNFENNVKQRLSRCLLAILPEESAETVVAANTENTAKWDSMMTWMILLSVQEEFRIKIGLDQIPKLTSFAAIEDYVVKKVGK
jgi:acyl carrier protein